MLSDYRSTFQSQTIAWREFSQRTLSGKCSLRHINCFRLNSRAASRIRKSVLRVCSKKKNSVMPAANRHCHDPYKKTYIYITATFFFFTLFSLIRSPHTCIEIVRRRTFKSRVYCKAFFFPFLISSFLHAYVHIKRTSENETCHTNA